MKKFLFLTAGFFVLVSCNDAQTNKEKININNESASTTSQAEQAKYLTGVPKVLRAIETGNFAKIDTLWADDFVDHVGRNGTDIKDRDSVMAGLVKMHNDIKDIKFEILSNAYDNGYSFTMSRLTGTTVNEWNGRQPNTKVDEIGIEVVKYRENGKATDHWHYADVNQIMQIRSKSDAKEAE